MKRIKITLSKAMAKAETHVKIVNEALSMLQIDVKTQAYENYGARCWFVSVSNDSRYRMLKSYLIDEFPSDIKLETYNATFDFEDHAETDLDGCSQSVEVMDMLLGFDVVIAKTLGAFTTEYKQQARKALAQTVNDQLTAWLDENFEHVD